MWPLETLETLHLIQPTEDDTKEVRRELLFSLSPHISLPSASGKRKQQEGK